MICPKDIHLPQDASYKSTCYVIQLLSVLSTDGFIASELTICKIYFLTCDISLQSTQWHGECIVIDERERYHVSLYMHAFCIRQHQHYNVKYTWCVCVSEQNVTLFYEPFATIHSFPHLIFFCEHFSFFSLNPVVPSVNCFPCLAWKQHRGSFQSLDLQGSGSLPAFPVRWLG